MAENKKGFILYTDIIGTVEEMKDAEAGRLFKHILRYVNDLNPEAPDRTTKLVFEQIKSQLKRDLIKYEETKAIKSDSGKLGNLKKWHKDLYKEVVNNKVSIDNAIVIAKDRTAIKSIAKIAVNDNVNDNDIKEINKENFLWTEHLKNFLNDFRWKEKFCRDKVVSLTRLETKMNDFISEIELREDFKDTKELKNHFTNWFNKKSIRAPEFEKQHSAPPLRRASEM